MGRRKEITLPEFLTESLRIEQIFRRTTPQEVRVTSDFLKLKSLAIPDLLTLLRVYQPDAQLRNRKGMDVQIHQGVRDGRHVFYYPPKGGPKIEFELARLLAKLDNYTPCMDHKRFEALHPFTDGNGRVGRAIWLWQMEWKPPFPRTFLHQFYYQALSEE